MTDLKTLVKNKEVVLFDMDGTLVNTEPLHAQAAVLVLDSLGVKVDLLSCIDQFYGMTDFVVIQSVCPNMSEAEIHFAIEQKNKELINIFRQLSPNEKESYLTPGIIDFLHHLRHLNKKCAVVSASEDIIVDETLACFGLDQFMQLQMGRNQTTLTKPHPDPYIEAMKRLKVTPEETLIFEDSPTGIKAATLSRAQVVRITEFSHGNSSQKFEGNFIELVNFTAF
ncbi:MAG: HAD family phosphatase [Bacteriovoracaceae bacterium]|nr:HAD family phosphatase [Bacteriovoracaceae bacterium]